ncbi:MAG: Glycosyl hydrolase family 20, catalytic domain [Lentisphaerae bacterium ADurb.Bin242]|nr:MAG: Glycosyl hydrolase family 20, catalytic domain [Lentisphaerae bacterium ADurb.Bin242]
MQYLHLDLKGIVPSEMQFYSWLDWFKKCGFDGLVMEYDCRVPWDTWADAGSPLFGKDVVTRLVGHAEKLGFEVIPLIQVHGHLEWILQNESYAYLRENGELNELCPLQPDSFPKMCQWIDEVAALHPNARNIHLGCDETWHLGSCPECRKKISGDPLQRGKMGLFIDHAAKLCRYAAEEKQLRPMIWDDMFCRDHGASLKSLSVFPEETIFVHWKYGRNTTDHLDLIRSTGQETWGASAVRCGWIDHHWKALNILGDRLDNIADWQKTDLNLIHTTWGRPNNLWNLYGPWEALIPPFIAAGNPSGWASHPWRLFVRALDEALLKAERPALENLAGEVLRLPAADPMETRAKTWFSLGIQYELMHLEALTLLQTDRCLKVLSGHGCRDVRRDEKWNTLRRTFREKVEEWEAELELFWKENQLSDFDEYRDTRRAGFFLDL